MERTQFGWQSSAQPVLLSSGLCREGTRRHLEGAHTRQGREADLRAVKMKAEERRKVLRSNKLIFCTKRSPQLFLSFHANISLR